MIDLARLHNLAEQARQRAVPAKTARSGNSWYRIANYSGAADTASVYLYDMIGEWGVTAQDFVNDLNGISAPNIDLHVNSEGGEVFDGIAIYEAIRQHPANVTAIVDSLAASAASFIVQAANARVMGRNARMMIHDAQGLTIGNSDAMREMANLLDDLSNNIADIYAERAGGTVKDWRSAMSINSGSGTWYGSQEAVDAGLADKVAEAQAAPAENKVPAGLAWDPTAFSKMVKEAVA